MPKNHVNLRKADLRERRDERFLVRARDAAYLCSVSKRHWDRMTASGKNPRPVRLSPGVVGWPPDELREWVHAGCPSREEWERQKALS